MATSRRSFRLDAPGLTALTRESRSPRFARSHPHVIGGSIQAAIDGACHRRHVEGYPDKTSKPLRLLDRMIEHLLVAQIEHLETRPAPQQIRDRTEVIHVRLRDASVGRRSAALASSSILF